MTPPACAGMTKGCTKPPSRGALQPSPPDVIDGVFSTGVRSTYLLQVNGDAGAAASAANVHARYHPPMLQMEVAFDTSCSRSLRWDDDLGFVCCKGESA
jgi:hypothetical protein